MKIEKLYRFHPVTGEDARRIFEPDFPRPPGCSDKEWREGHEEIQTSKVAGWLPYWREDDLAPGTYERCFDQNFEFVARVMGAKVEKIETPPAITV